MDIWRLDSPVKLLGEIGIKTKQQPSSDSVMEILLGISLLVNTLFIWQLVSNSDSKYTYEDIANSIKNRDDEYRQLIFEYLKETYGSDLLRAGKEQGRFYDIGRRMKMFKS